MYVDYKDFNVDKVVIDTDITHTSLDHADYLGVKYIYDDKPLPLIIDPPKMKSEYGMVPVTDFNTKLPTDTFTITYTIDQSNIEWMNVLDILLSKVNSHLESLSMSKCRDIIYQSKKSGKMCLNLSIDKDHDLNGPSLISFDKVHLVINNRLSKKVVSDEGLTNCKVGCLKSISDRVNCEMKDISKIHKDKNDLCRNSFTTLNLIPKIDIVSNDEETITIYPHLIIYPYTITNSPLLFNLFTPVTSLSIDYPMRVVKKFFSIIYSNDRLTLKSLSLEDMEEDMVTQFYYISDYLGLEYCSEFFKRVIDSDKYKNI